MEPAVCAYHTGGQSINKNARHGICEHFTPIPMWKIKSKFLKALKDSNHLKLLAPKILSSIPDFPFCFGKNHFTQAIKLTFRFMWLSK